MIKQRTMWLAPCALALLALTGCDRFVSVEARMARAEQKLESGEYQSALIDLRKVLGEEPGHIEAHLLSVDVLLKSGDAHAANAQLDRAIAAGATPEQTERRRLEILLALGDLQELETALNASTTLPTSVRSVFRGRLLLAKQEPAEAEAAFDEALAAEPGHTGALLGRIEAIAARGQRTEALRALDEHLASHPEHGSAWLLKGSLAMRSGDFATAAATFAKAQQFSRSLTRTELLQAHVLRIESLLGLGQVDAAQKTLSQLEQLAEGLPIISLMRGKVAFAAKDIDGAVNHLREFARVAPQHMPGRLLLASALLEQGNTEQAYAEAVRNVAEFRTAVEPRLALAQIELRLGRLTEAEDTLQPLIARSPPHPLATAMLAELRVRRGEALAGISLLQQSLSEQPDNPRLQLQLAAAHLAAGDPKRAVETLDGIKTDELSAARARLRIIATAATQGAASTQKALDAAIAEHPDDVDLLLTAASYYRSINQIERARSFARKARAVRPQDATLTLLLGHLELAAGDVERAEGLAKEVLEKAPVDSAAMMLMADAAARRGEDEEVDAWLSRARSANPRALGVRVSLARRALARGNPSEARAVLTEAVRNAPADPNARLALAELHAATERYADALAELREAARQRPSSPAILLAMARVQLASHDRAGARENLAKAMELSPGWAPAAVTLAAIETAEGNLPAALELVNELRRHDPQGPTSYALEGDVYMAAKRPADAAKAFVAAYQRAPSAVLATRAIQAKSAAGAPKPETEILDWLARNPGDASARRVLAEYHLATGQTSAAIKELELVVEQRPSDALALNNLAWLYQGANDPRARATAKRAYDAAPNVAAIADTYGWILIQERETQGGLKILEQAARLAPENGDILFHYAFALNEANQPERAAQTLRRATQLPAPFPARKAAEDLLARIGAE